VSEQAGHHLHNFRVLGGPPGKLKGSVMVCCQAYWELQMWQRVDILIDRESVEQSTYRFVCPIPICRRTIELDTSEIKRQMVESASRVPEETEGP
jgi:hypothetical protein